MIQYTPHATYKHTRKRAGYTDDTDFTDDSTAKRRCHGAVATSFHREDATLAPHASAGESAKNF
jgi:hypothetical protein